MKQTAVEWLVEKFNTEEFIYRDRTKIIEQAKEMEKKQKGYSKEDILINIELAMIQGLTLGEYRDLLIEQFKIEKL